MSLAEKNTYVILLDMGSTPTFDIEPFYILRYNVNMLLLIRELTLIKLQ